MSQNTSIMLILRDVNSRGIIGTDASAKTLGLNSGIEFADKLISELPCKSVAEHASQFEQQNTDLINSKNVTKSLHVLNVFHYSDGLTARISNRRIFTHKQSSSILGTISTAYSVKLKHFMQVIPDYILQLGEINSVETIQGQTQQIKRITLNDYEQEICFLLILGWSFTQIATFLDQHRPNPKPRTADTIVKKKNYICQKLHLRTTHVPSLCKHLIKMGFSINMPSSFYSLIIGSKVIAEQI